MKHAYRVQTEIYTPDYTQKFLTKELYEAGMDGELVKLKYKDNIELLESMGHDVSELLMLLEQVGNIKYHYEPAIRIGERGFAKRRVTYQKVLFDVGVPERAMYEYFGITRQGLNSNIQRVYTSKTELKEKRDKVKEKYRELSRGVVYLSVFSEAELLGLEEGDIVRYLTGKDVSELDTTFLRKLHHEYVDNFGGKYFKVPHLELERKREEDREKVRKLHEQGYSNYAISKKLNITTSKVGNLLNSIHNRVLRNHLNEQEINRAVEQARELDPKEIGNDLKQIGVDGKVGTVQTLYFHIKDADLRDEIYKLYKEGYTVSELAKKYGIAENTVIGKLRRIGTRYTTTEVSFLEVQMKRGEELLDKELEVILKAHDRQGSTYGIYQSVVNKYGTIEELERVAKELYNIKE